MKPSKNIVASASVGLILVAALVTFPSKRKPGSPEETPKPAEPIGIAGGTSPQRPLTGPAEYEWRTGDQASYDYQTSMSLGQATSSEWKLEANGGETETALRGQLHFVVMEASSSSVTLACQGSGFQVTADGWHDSLMEGLLNGTPQTLTLSLDGRVLSRSFPSRVTSEDRKLLAGLTQVQWVLGKSDAWTETEMDDAGTYVCAYRRMADGAMSKSRKSRPSAEGEVDFALVRSSFHAQRGTFWLQTVDGEEESTMSYEGKTLMTLVSKVRLARSARNEVPADLLALSAEDVRAGFVDEASAVEGGDGLSTLERRRLARLQKKYGNVPCDVVFGQLEDAVAKSSEHADTLPAIDALRDWIEANPDKAGEVAAALRDSSLSQEVTARAIHALELAGRTIPQAQDALGDLLHDRDSYADDTVLQAIVASGDVGELRSAKVFEALRDIVANPRPGDTEDFQWSDSALFSFGRLAEQNPQAEDALIAALTPQLESPQDYAATDLVTALQSLANGRVADEAMLRHASALATHFEPEVRSALVDYMQRAYPQDTDVAKRALQDPSELVQATGVAVLAHPETATEESLDFLRSQESRPDLTPQIKQTIADAINQHAETVARFTAE